MQTEISPPLKWHGGKHYLAKKIISLFPPRCKTPNSPDKGDAGYLHFCEPYFGGGAVLFAHDPEGISEVVNDKNGELTNFWHVMADRHLFPEFQRIIQAVPFGESVYRHNAKARPVGEVDGALAFFIRCRQSMSGRMKDFAPLTRNRTRRGMNEQASAWLSAVEGLPAVHERLKRVVILNRSALDVIRQQDGPRTLFYADPPYCHSTRATTGEYAHEMTDADHADLLTVLGAIKGRFILSGYRCDLYDAAAQKHNWRREDIEIANHAAGGSAKRRMTESLWLNY